MSKRILIPLDGSATAEQVLPHALACSGPETELVLLRVLEPVLLPDRGLALADSLKQEAGDALGELTLELARRGARVRARVAPAGPVDETILAVAREEVVDLIALTSHGRRGLERWFLGSVAERLLRAAPVPVLLVRANPEAPLDWRQVEPPTYRRMLIPLDGSPLSETALQFGQVVPLRPERVTLVQASDIPVFLGRDLLDREVLTDILGESEEYLRSLSRAEELQGVEVRCQALDAMAWEAILELAEEGKVDLIVMATAGRSGLKRWLLGSVAEKVSRSAPCPLLLLNPRCLEPDSQPTRA